MYALLALLVAAASALIMLAIPFHHEAWLMRWIRKAHRALLATAKETLVGGVRDASYRGWIRVWGGSSAVLFALFGILDGAVIQNRFQSVAAAVFYAALAMGISAFVVLTCAVYWSLLARLRGYAALRRAGMRALWLADERGCPASLKEQVATLAQRTSHVGVLDVTGHDLLGKGPGRNGGLLYDALNSAKRVPVSLLLLEADGQNRDPERRQATVFQTVLAESGLSSTAYQRRLRATLQAVEDLNETRPAEGRIEVQFYNEKPPFQAVVFDGSALVAPCCVREGFKFFSHVVQPGKSRAPCFYEMFRRQFTRIWGGVEGPVRPLKAPPRPALPPEPQISAVLRAQPTG